ncbi:adenylate kinase family protein [Candidatus Woesearchaeota archaeon]|nr:adenylate kinase family protein [Candidatus Woesearchaeota archaeon]
MKVVIVSGTPGTGKTTLSKKLAKKLNFYYLDVNETIKKYRLSEGYDKKRKTKIVDVKKLNRALIKEISNIKKNKNSIKGDPIKIFYNIKKPIKKNNKTKSVKNNKNVKNGIIIDSHLSHYLPKKYVNLCIITKCDLKELERRLKKKNYSKQKIRENLDAEIFDICLNEAKERVHRAIVINTTKGINIGEISRKTGGSIDI